MSEELIAHTLDGATIHQRVSDGYINATALCQAAGKLFADYRRNAGTEAYFRELGAIMGIPINALIESRQGRPEHGGGTWVQPDATIHLAMWLSPKFGVQVTKWTRELLTTGKVELQATPTLAPYTHRVMAAAEVELVVPHGHWCVFMEAAAVLIKAELILVPAGLGMDADDLLDGSVGIRYGQYRRDKSWAGAVSYYTYRFPPPSKRSGIQVTPKAYLNSELLHFRDWLKAVYLPVHFPTYIQNKYGVDGWQKALPHVRKVMPAALAAGTVPRPPSA